MTDRDDKLLADAHRRLGEAMTARIGAFAAAGAVSRRIIPLSAYMKPPDPGWLALYEDNPESFEPCGNCGAKGFVNWDTVKPNERCEECRGVGHRLLTAPK